MLLVIFIYIINSKSSVILTIKKFKLKLFPFNKSVTSVLCIILCSALLFNAIQTVDADDWIMAVLDSTKLYETEYTDPKETEIIFPEQKRNLIYILMESMETTFFDRNQGGALKENAIPELYTLAENNINFSDTDSVGGINAVSGATWTIGALVAQTAGIPLDLPIDGNSMDNYSSFLPGAYTLNDALHQNGYQQSFLCGSNADFGGRRKYFEQHGVDKIYDYETAQRDGIIPADYHDGWWGMEDYNLYEYAKQKLTEISKQEKPFAMFMLTVDTHHIGGNFCSLCKEIHNEQYINVYNCASRQLNSFIYWLKNQYFYDNTTIIIVGDHPSMDAEFMSRNIKTENYNRQIYNCFINSAVSANNSKSRICTQLDMYPTVLSALGCEIVGNSLGLGVNLFSNKQTLAEKYGLSAFNTEISKKSNIYDKKLLYV